MRRITFAIFAIFMLISFLLTPLGALATVEAKGKGKPTEQQRRPQEQKTNTAARAARQPSVPAKQLKVRPSETPVRPRSVELDVVFSQEGSETSLQEIEAGQKLIVQYQLQNTSSRLLPAQVIDFSWANPGITGVKMIERTSSKCRLLNHHICQATNLGSGEMLMVEEIYAIDAEVVDEVLTFQLKAASLSYQGKIKVVAPVPPPSGGTGEVVILPSKVHSGVEWSRPTAESTTITSEFGPRWGTFHNGTDYGLPCGSSLYAVAKGDVIATATNGVVLGNLSQPGAPANYVIIDHNGSGWRSLYWHMQTVAVNTGQPVLRGEFIGTSGNTGYVRGSDLLPIDQQGCHLHFELSYLGTKVDPEGVLGGLPL